MTFNIPQPKEDVISKAIFKTSKLTQEEIARENSKKIINDLEEIGVFA